MQLKLTCVSKMLIKQTHFSSTAKPNKRASTFPFKSEWQRNTTQQQRTQRSLFRERQPRAILLKISTSDVEGRKKDGRFVCLCWFGLDMPREPFKPFVRLNFFLCYIYRLRFKQTTSNMKAQKRYYGERMTTCIGREQGERGEIQEKDEKKSWCKEGEGDWKEAEIDVMRYYSDGMYACGVCVCMVNACMQVMQIKELWFFGLKHRFPFIVFLSVNGLFWFCVSPTPSRLVCSWNITAMCKV